jgi:hypothetical protein
MNVSGERLRNSFARFSLIVAPCTDLRQNSRVAKLGGGNGKG